MYYSAGKGTTLVSHNNPENSIPYYGSTWNELYIPYDLKPPVLLVRKVFSALEIELWNYDMLDR